MNGFPNLIKETLNSLINEIARSPELFVKNPGKDFTRNRKLSFENVVKLIICMGGNSIYKELLESQGYDFNTATTSAFIQQRDKILHFAFEYLFHEFTQSRTQAKLFKGYRLFAVDGSELPIATNPNDLSTYYKTRENARGYNLLQLNAMYDLLNKIYSDIYILPSKLQNEKKALCSMIDRSRIKEKSIIVADRNFEGYNNFAHIEQKGWFYVIRVKDIESRAGILSGLNLNESGEFDVQVNRILTRKQTNEIKAQPEIYKYICTTSTFDFLDLHTNKFYPISFRVVRVKLDNGSYESIITNLDAVEFPACVIKKLYAMRWGIETSFRELKYTVGLTSFHAKKQEYIIQEIFGRLIMYNFTEIITSHVVISKTKTHHIYQVNFTVALHVCRHFLRLWNNVPPPDVEAVINKNILPVRPNRSQKRKIKHQAAVSFLYRVA